MSEPAGSISVYGPSQCGEEGRECLLTLSGAARWPRAPSRRSSSGRGRGLGACRGSSRRCLLCGARRPPEIGSARSRPRQHNHDPRSLLALDSHHGKARRRRHGRGFGLVTAALLLPSPWYSRYGFLVFYGICRKNKEPTSGLEPLTCSLRVGHYRVRVVLPPWHKPMDKSVSSSTGNQ